MNLTFLCETSWENSIAPLIQSNMTKKYVEHLTKIVNILQLKLSRGFYNKVDSLNL